MKARKLTGILALILMLLIAGCGKEDALEGTSETAVSEVPMDIVSEIAGAVSEENSISWMDDEQKSNYIILLDGCPDQEAYYYLYDITGDGVPELMLGKDMVSVYSYNQGAVMTIGTLAVQKAWMSEQYGLLAYCENNGTYELRQYQYDGEMMKETVLASASNTADYDSQAAGYLENAQELDQYELADRTPFE